MTAEYATGEGLHVCYQSASASSPQMIGNVTVDGLASSSSYTGWNTAGSCYNGENVASSPFTFTGTGLSINTDHVKFVSAGSPCSATAMAVVRPHSCCGTSRALVGCTSRVCRCRHLSRIPHP